MKFNYDLYRPKRIIQDAWKSNGAYFHSKDVRVTPLTKIGDADEVHKSRSARRIPALAKKLKPKRLTLSEVLPRRKSVLVRSTNHQKRAKAPVSMLSGTFTEQLDAPPAKGQPAWRFNANVGAFRKEPAVNARRNLLAWSNPVLKYLVLAIVVIGIGTGSVHAYISRSNAAHPEVLGQSGNQTKTQEENPNAQKGSGETPPTTPEPPATSAPATQAAPQSSVPTTNATSADQPSPPSNPVGVANSNTEDTAAPAPAPQATGNPVPPVPATAPVNVPDPPTAPTSQPQPTTPQSDGTDNTQKPDKSQPITNPDTIIDIHIAPTTPPTPRKTGPTQEQKSSTQSLTEQ